MTGGNPIINRRQLLTAGGAAVATAMLPGIAQAGTKPATSKSWLERGTYSSRVGQRFTMGTPSGRTLLTLTAVRDLEGRNSKGKTLARRNDAFVLVFEGPAGSAAFQQTREFTHPALGRHALFVVAGRGVGGKLIHTVTVNRSG